MRYSGIADLSKPGQLDLDSHDEAISPAIATLQFRRSRAGCPDPGLPYVCDHRAAVVARRTAAYCARSGATGENPRPRGGPTRTSPSPPYNFWPKCPARSPEMDDAAVLPGDQAIKQLKARYCRLPRHQGVGGVAQDLRPTTSSANTSQPGGRQGDPSAPAEFVAFTCRPWRNRATAHQVHAPEIELTSATTACTGI